MKHGSGLPLELHYDLFRIPHYRAPLMDMWKRSLTQEIVGVPVHVLAPPDMLLHVCGHASCSSSRDTLRWVCDAWYVIAQCANSDWDVLVDGALRSRLALPLSVIFRYLVDELDAPIPAPVLLRLVAAARRMSVVGREAALAGARAGGRGTLENLFRQAGGGREWVILLKWMFLPSPDYLRWTYTIRSSWLLPFYYVYRPLRYITRCIWAAVKRCSGPRRSEEALPDYGNG